MPPVNTPLTDLLAGTALFGGLSAADLHACAELFHQTKMNRGEVLFSVGEAGRILYLVGRGRVRLAVATPEGRELTFRVVESGELFGEIAVLDGGPRTAEATAISNGTLYTIDGSAFRELWTTRKAIITNVVSFLCKRLRQTSDQAQSIALYPIEVRLARFLLQSLQGRPAAPGKRLAVELGYSQGELAQLVGASRPKVNMALGILERSGALKRTLDRIFCDPEKLARIAQQND
jgi:CRP/FNR family cyclic AMP-dependent transcriptional regulator